MSEKSEQPGAGSFLGQFKQPTANQREAIFVSCWILQKWKLFKKSAALGTLLGGLILLCPPSYYITLLLLFSAFFLVNDICLIFD